MTIAVLAVQGAFIEHEKKLQALGADVFEIRQAKDLERHFDGLVLPGGESTVQGKLLPWTVCTSAGEDQSGTARYGNLCGTDPFGRAYCG